MKKPIATVSEEGMVSLVAALQDVSAVADELLTHPATRTRGERLVLATQKIIAAIAVKGKATG